MAEDRQKTDDQPTKSGRERRLENLKKGKHYSSTYQPANNTGRRPSKIKAMVKDNNLSSDDVRAMYKMLFDMEESEIKELIKNPKTPMLIKNFAKAFLNDLSVKNAMTSQKMIDWIYGKAAETHKHTGVMEITTMTPEQRRDRIKELEEKLKEAEEVEP